MSAYFVTGIGTDVGKTFTACALLHGARAAGREAAALKPVACGVDQAQGGDVAELNAASGHVYMEQSPWWFKQPLSPNMAAAAEGKSVELTSLTEWTLRQIPEDGFTLIESVGGLLVPLNDHQTVREWMVALGLPAIVIASNYLGALNHTLMTLDLLRAAKLKVAALVISESQGGVSLSETEATIRSFARDIPLIISQPRVSSWRQASAVHALAKELA